MYCRLDISQKRGSADLSLLSVLVRQVSLSQKKSCLRVEQFSPLSNAEDRSLMQALQASLRPIPTDPEVSEDELEDESAISEKFEKDESEDESEEESEEESALKLKWTKKPQEVGEKLCATLRSDFSYSVYSRCNEFLRITIFQEDMGAHS